MQIEVHRPFKLKMQVRRWMLKLACNFARRRILHAILLEDESVLDAETCMQFCSKTNPGSGDHVKKRAISGAEKSPQSAQESMRC
jgi:hypothetical protein